MKYDEEVSQIVKSMKNDTYVFRWKVIEQLPENLQKRERTSLHVMVTKAMKRQGLVTRSKKNRWGVFVWGDKRG